jgi:hypothetical protein
MRGWSVAFKICVSILTLVISSQAHSQRQTPESVAKLDRDTRYAWNSFYRVFAADSAEFDGEYFTCLGHSHRYDSSAYLREDQVRKDNTRKIQRGVTTRLIRPSKEEIQAAVQSLPGLSIGSYGRVQRVRIDELLAPNGMVLSRLEIVDEDKLNDDFAEARDRAGYQRKDEVEAAFAIRKEIAKRQDDPAYRGPFRLVGFSTDRRFANQDWTGPNGEGLFLAVVGIESLGTERRPQPRKILAPSEAFQRGIEEAGFVALLEQRGVSPQQFVQMVRDARQEHGRDGDARVAEQLMRLPITPSKEAEAPASEGSADQ